MIPFIKAHANGNDFLILEESLAGRRHAALAQRLCARSTGIGADGIEFLDRARPNGELFLRLFNADGSEAELSGNGTRCVAAFLAHTEGRHEVILGTHGGPRHCRVISQTGSTWQIETGMGVPRVMPRTLAMDSLPDGATAITGVMVNVGNPHFVLFTDTNTAATEAVNDEDFSVHGLPWQQLGARIATDPRFPHGTNVEFVRILASDRIAFRIYERGCGPTTSSGTGTCASASAAIALRGAATTLTAIAQGGPQQVVWPTTSDQMRLTGPAELLCTGYAFDPAADLHAALEDMAL